MAFDRSLSICFVSQEYPEETGWGGVGAYTYEMAHGLAESGHQVVVLSRALQTPGRSVEKNGVEVIRILPRLRLSRAPLLWRLNRWWDGYRLAVAAALKAISTARPVDVVEAPEMHAEPLLYYALRRTPPLVVRLHSSSRLIMQYEPGEHRAGFHFNQWLEQWLIGRAACITAPSGAVLAHTPAADPRSPRAVIPNPVDTDLFAAQGSTTHDLNLKPIEILCCGRPRFLKGFHVVARAIPRVWAKFPGARFTFLAAPGGPAGADYHSQLAAILDDLIHHPNVAVEAPMSRVNMPARYRQADICIVPSLWESFGYVCAEAMACGLPVIASRVGGLAELVEHGRSGLLVEPGSAQALADAICELAPDAGRRRQLGLAARARIEAHFSRRAVIPRAVALYSAVALSAHA